MKKYLSIIAVLMLSVCFIFSGCTPKLTMPNGDISSNGGSVVMVGDYVYYANTFVDHSSLSGDANTEKTTKQNALYRLKTNEFGYTVKDEDNQIQNVEKVYSKIAGFNNSNMFVVGDYLYFTSPNVHKEDTGADKFDLTTLFRIKLDGTEFKEILTTKTSQGKFYLVTEENPYLLIFDDNKVSKLDIGNKITDPSVLVENALDTVFPKTYGKLSHFFYTTDINKEDKDAGLNGNYLYRYNLSDKTSTSLGKSGSQTIKLVAFENNTLYYTMPDGSGVSPYYSSTLSGGFGANQTRWTVLGEVDGTDSISNFVVINDSCVVYKAESKIFLAQKGDGELANYSVLIDSDVNIETVDGDYVYYSNSDGLYRISYKDKVVQTVAEQKNIKTGSCDIAGEFVYFYAKLSSDTTGTSYAFRANIKTPGLTTPAIKCECIATVLAEDLESEA